MRALIDEEERRLADKAEEQDQEKCGRNDSRRRDASFVMADTSGPTRLRA